MRAKVYKSTGSWYQVKDATGNQFSARLKGVFKIDGISSTNPIAVGDEVEVVQEHDADNTVMITEILPRHNYVNRQSPRNPHQHHIIASNLDQSLLIATLREPRTSQGFIDRFLVGCELYHVPAIIAFNKTDLYRAKELEQLQLLTDRYQAIGYTVCGMSIKTEEGVDRVKQLLVGKTTLVSGHSGVGKSTFINAVFPDMAALRTKDVSGWSGKGMHTTTFAEMFDLPGGGAIIDTPGIREFGVVGVDREELSHYFPEMRKRLKDCQFNNCTHFSEPGCAIKAAVNSGAISEDRYVSYLNIMDSIEPPKY
jgi:ribosome biogenesis GTPase / thiamine phosphate phosphatase